jgi:protein-S-isoprenylcysteine O-methyltransferase Ste14
MATQLKPRQTTQPSDKAQSTIRNVLVLVYGTLCYLIFLGTLVYAIGWVEDIGTPTTLDAAPSAPVGVAVCVDLVLLGLFVAQHSIMARPAFKRWWTRVIPHTIERSTFVLLASLLFLLLFWQWRPIGGVIWQVDNGFAKAMLVAISLLGWLLVVVSTFAINHFDLWGLRQVYLAFRRKAYTELPFREVGLYKVVRHPMNLGLLIAFWATPRMTAGHLLYALATTAYIVLAVRLLEERDLVRAFGDTYTAYRRRVPMLLPLARSRTR